MHIISRDGTLTIMHPDGEMQSVPYTSLGRADMLLQAQYHRWIRDQEYRRQLVCRLCGEDMDVNSDVDEKEGSWSILLVCHCRALYGKIPLREIASAMTNWNSSPATSGVS